MRKVAWQNSYGYSMVEDNGRYLLEHRAVVERALGRRLSPGEHVHHIDGDKQNNSLGNLRVMGPSEHSRLHANKRWEARNNRGRCVICQRWGRPPGVCLDCQKEYGLVHVPYAQYPEWVKYLFREKRRDDRRRLADQRRLVSLDGLEEAGADFDTAGNLCGGENALPSDEPGLAYAPYPDGATNREYRRANGIKELERDKVAAAWSYIDSMMGDDEPEHDREG